MEFNPDYSESKFGPVAAGVHFVRVIDAEASKTQKGVPLITWTMESFGNENPIQNGKKVWHRTEISGQFSGMLKLFLQAINPEYAGGPFNTEEYLGKELEITVEYPMDKQTGQPSQYSRIKRVAPFVGAAGDIPAFSTEPTYNSGNVPF